MSQFDSIISRARSNPKHIVLAEGGDERVIEGGLRAARDGLAVVTILGDPDNIRPTLKEFGGDVSTINVIEPDKSPARRGYADTFYQLRKHKGVDEKSAESAVSDPLIFADLMVREGDAAGSLGGATRTTADVVRTAFQVIGIDNRYSLVSSFFIMLLEEEFHDFKGSILFADCALIVDPDEEQLVQIASATADSANTLLNLDPKLAMLSFSTRQSAGHQLVDKVDNAARRLKELRPDIPVEGGIQFDASFVPEIGNQKAPESAVAGNANVMIFPDLNSGNIGYKIAERIGKAKAIGPILQGLAKPANDLSRGCGAEDIYRMIAVTSVQAQVTDQKKNQLSRTSLAGNNNDRRQ